MSSSVKMLIAGFSLIVFTLAAGIYCLIFNPLLTTIITTFQDNTPPYWWNYLGGGQITWIVSFIWIIILLGEVLMVVRLFTQPAEQTDYDMDGW